MRSDHLEPARSIISRLGGVDTVAEATRRSRTRVFRWMYPQDRGGTGGLIPQREIPRLIELARSTGIELDANDFLPAQRVGEVAA